MVSNHILIFHAESKERKFVHKSFFYETMIQASSPPPTTPFPFSSPRHYLISKGTQIKHILNYTQKATSTSMGKVSINDMPIKAPSYIPRHQYLTKLQPCHKFSITTEDYISPATSHIGSNCHCPKTTTLCYNFCFPLNIFWFCIQNLKTIYFSLYILKKKLKQQKVIRVSFIYFLSKGRAVGQLQIRYHYRLQRYLIQAKNRLSFFRNKNYLKQVSLRKYCIIIFYPFPNKTIETLPREEFQLLSIAQTKNHSAQHWWCRQALVDQFCGFQRFQLQLHAISLQLP